MQKHYVVAITDLYKDVSHENKEKKFKEFGMTHAEYAELHHKCDEEIECHHSTISNESTRENRKIINILRKCPCLNIPSERHNG